MLYLGKLYCNLSSKVLKRAARYLKWHLCVFIQYRHIKHQPPQQMLKHGRPQIPGGQIQKETKGIENLMKDVLVVYNSSLGFIL